MSLFFVLPAFNEAECIEGVVRDWLELAKRYEARVVVVNDGSTDSTPDLLDGLARAEPALTVLHQRNLGHGPAILAGYRHALAAGADWVFQVDADNQLYSADFPLLWERRDSSPFILGWRKERNDGLSRTIISRVLSWMIFFSFGERMRDANIPFRLMRADLLASLLPLLPPDLFSPNVFLGLLAKKRGADLLEVPVRHRPRETGNYFSLRVRVIPLCLRSARQLLWLGLSGFGKKRHVAE